MIWATVSSRSCFCWLYRAFSFSAAKNIINLISVLTIWWYRLWCCWKRVFAMSSVFSWQNSVSLCLLHFVLQGRTCLLFQVFLTFYFCIPVPYDENHRVFPALPSIGASASALVLPINFQDWSPLGWSGWISLLTKGLSRIFSGTTVPKHRFFGTQFSIG